MYGFENAEGGVDGGPSTTGGRLTRINRRGDKRLNRVGSQRFQCRTEN